MWLVLLLILFRVFCYRGGDAFARSCSKTLEPEDVTMGFIVGMQVPLWGKTQ